MKQKKKVIILTEGGKNIGFGHITRCISICQAFEGKGIMPEFIVNGDGLIGDLLRRRKYQAFNWLKEKERLFNLIQDVDIGIIDSYLADLEFYEKISRIIRIPVYIDDNRRFNYPRGVVINGMVYADELDYSETEGATYLLGSKYTILRKEFQNAPKKDIKENLERIMITFGGDDKRNMTSKILKFLNKNCPAITKDIIIGGGFHDKAKIEDMKNENTNLIYNPDARGMKEAMMKSDLAISAGGQTLYELAKAGVPTIGICVARNQLRNLRGWHSKGFLEFIGWHYEKKLLKKLKKSILLLLPYEEREKRYKTGINSIDGKGTERIVDFLVKHKGKAPKSKLRWRLKKIKKT